MTKRKVSNARQSSFSTQTLDLPANQSSPDVEIFDSYFEEGFHNLGINVQLQTTTDDFQLFSVGEI